MADKQFLDQLAQRLADEGKLVEAGWVGFRLVLMPDASAEAMEFARLAYMSGAQHLFAMILTMLDPGTEETSDDLRRMDLINAELAAFFDTNRDDG